MNLVEVLREERAASRKKIAESYIDHILIALRAEDSGAPFRTFIDNWYAFQVGEGHLTGTERPVWFNNPCARTHRRALRRMHFVSESAERIINLAECNHPDYLKPRAAKDVSVRLMVDHSVPLSVITNMMFEHDFQKTREAVVDHLNRWYRLGVLSAAEDKQLNAAGLRSKMPRKWDGQDPFARYGTIGIKRRQQPSG